MSALLFIRIKVGSAGGRGGRAERGGKRWLKVLGGKGAKCWICA